MRRLFICKLRFGANTGLSSTSARARAIIVNGRLVGIITLKGALGGQWCKCSGHNSGIGGARHKYRPHPRSNRNVTTSRL